MILKINIQYTTAIDLERFEYLIYCVGHWAVQNEDILEDQSSKQVAFKRQQTHKICT